MSMPNKLIRVKNEKLLQYEYYCSGCGELLKVISYTGLEQEPLFTISHVCTKKRYDNNK